MKLTPELIKKFDDALFGFRLETASPLFGIAVRTAETEFVYGPTSLDYDTAQDIEINLYDDPRILDTVIVRLDPNGEYSAVLPDNRPWDGKNIGDA